MSVAKIAQMRNAHILQKEFPFELKELNKGYADQTLRIDLSHNDISIHPVSQQMKDLWIGGKGFDLWLMFQEVTTGAHNDLEMATSFAQKMVCEYGMSKKLGHLTFGKKDREVFLGRDLLREKDYSESTAIMIDQEVQRIVGECFERARDILTSRAEELRKLANRLLEKEVLDQAEVRAIVGLEPEPQPPGPAPAA